VGYRRTQGIPRDAWADGGISVLRESHTRVLRELWHIAHVFSRRTRARDRCDTCQLRCPRAGAAESRLGAKQAAVGGHLRWTAAVRPRLERGCLRKSVNPI